MSKRIRKMWTSEELEQLKVDYGVLSTEELEVKYNRKYSNIKQKCINSGIVNNRKKKWNTENEKEFKLDWENRKMSTNEMEIKYNTTYEGLRSKAQELGANRREIVFTNMQIAKIIKLYEDGSNTHEIAEKFYCSHTYIIKTLKENNIYIRNASESKQKYSINEDYFKKIETEEQAYYLGFLYADGCNHTDKNTISMGLHGKDIEVLEGFRQAIGSPDRPIRLFKQHGLDTVYSGISVTNKKMSEDLNKIGMIKNKSLKLVYPELKESLNRHFIRGYFDGDGHIGLYGSDIRITMLSTNEFLEKAREIVAKGIESLNIDSIKIYRAKPTTEVMVMGISGGIQVEKFLDYLYKNSNYYLSRKFNKYIDVKNREKDRWKDRRKKYGKRGSNKRTIAEKSFEYISNEMVSGKISKKELFGMFMSKKNVSNANIYHHSKSLEKIINEKGLRDSYDIGYGYIEKYIDTGN